MNGGSKHQAQYEERLSERLSRLADGRWADILQSAGLSPRTLSRKKVECPMHEGTKGKFRFENKDGNGLWYCAVCKSGDGMKLLMAVTGKSYTESAKWVIDLFEGNRGLPKPTLVPRQQYVPREKSADDIARLRASYAKIWNEAAPIKDGDLAAIYLQGRVPGLEGYPSALRLHPGLPFYGQPGDDGSPGKNYGMHPCMVGAVVDETGRACNIHRTFLSSKGKKLAIEEPDSEDPTILVALPAKKLMPSIGAKHYQIRLAKPVDGMLGIAEGIETALASMVYSGVPTWSTVADSGMANFLVPEEVTFLVIFADNDLKTVRGGNPGLDAARKLVQREDLQRRIEDGSLRVVIRTPETPGTDMANFLQDVAAQS
jgi:putative DNA primase/helicase